MTVREWRRARWILIGAAAFAAALLLTVAGNSLGHYRGWNVPRLEPAALSAKLAPLLPHDEAAGRRAVPDRAALFRLRWAEGQPRALGGQCSTRRAGRRSSSTATPRAASPTYEVWRLVCAGQIFMGSERAGDVLVSIDDARRMRFVDPDSLVLIGSSHGGWAIMDLLALDPPRRLPFNLATLPAGAPADPLAGVVGAILLYPYCGQANRAAPRRLAPADPDPVPAQRRRHRCAVGELPGDRRPAGGEGPAGRNADLRGRQPRLRSGGSLGVQSAPFRRDRDRRGPPGRRRFPARGSGGTLSSGAFVMRGAEGPRARGSGSGRRRPAARPARGREGARRGSAARPRARAGRAARRRRSGCRRRRRGAGAGGRAGSKRSGSAKRAGSRLAAASRQPTVSPRRKRWPKASASARAKRVKRWSGGSKRSTSSTVAAVAAASAKSRSGVAARRQDRGDAVADRVHRRLVAGVEQQHAGGDRARRCRAGRPRPRRRSAR